MKEELKEMEEFSIQNWKKKEEKIIKEESEEREFLSKME
jgi:hypothetical protein